MNNEKIIELQKNVVKRRESNLELFRIITMILIVAHHYVVNSGLTLPNGPINADIWSWRSIFLLLFGAWGKTGINCFVLITGYFMCKSQITLKKFLKLLFEIMFYRIVLYIIFLACGYEQFSLEFLLKAIVPIMNVQQGFTGCYLLFFLCIPFLNVLIKSMKEKQHVYLILLLSFIYVFFGTIPFLNVDMNYVSWFIVLYFIASYFRLYPKKLFENVKFWGVMSVISILLSISSIFACIWLGTKLNRSLAYAFVTDSNTFLAVTNGICWFMFFKNLKIKYNKVINLMGSTTFGVLLIHANSDTMRRWLWQDILNNVGMYSSQWLILHSVLSVLMIFILCSIIDLLRIYFIEKPFFKWFDKKENKICNLWSNKENEVFNKLKINNKGD